MPTALASRNPVRIRIGLALVVLVVPLSIAYRARQSNAGVFSRGVGGFVFLLTIGAAFTILRVISQREQLIRDLRGSEQKTAEIRDLLHTTLTSIGDGVIERFVRK